MWLANISRSLALALASLTASPSIFLTLSFLGDENRLDIALAFAAFKMAKRRGEDRGTKLAKGRCRVWHTAWHLLIVVGQALLVLA